MCCYMFLLAGWLSFAHRSLILLEPTVHVVDLALFFPHKEHSFLSNHLLNILSFYTGLWGFSCWNPSSWTCTGLMSKLSVLTRGVSNVPSYYEDPGMHWCFNEENSSSSLSLFKWSRESCGNFHSSLQILEYINLPSSGFFFFSQVLDSSASAFQCQDCGHVLLGLVGNGIFIIAPHNNMDYSVHFESCHFSRGQWDLS